MFTLIAALAFEAAPPRGHSSSNSELTDGIKIRFAAYNYGDMVELQRLMLNGWGEPAAADLLDLLRLAGPGRTVATSPIGLAPYDCN